MDGKRKELMLVNTRAPQRRGSQSVDSVKNEAHDCYMPNDVGVKVKVYRVFFLATLDLGRDTFQRWVRDDNLHPTAIQNCLMK